MLGNFQVTTLMLFTPLLAFLRPLFFFVGKTAGFADVECLIILMRLFNHLFSSTMGCKITLDLLSRLYFSSFMKSTRSSKSRSDIRQRGISSPSGSPAGSTPLMIALFNVSSV